jgi:hypothetical protein
MLPQWVRLAMVPATSHSSSEIARLSSCPRQTRLIGHALQRRCSFVHFTALRAANRTSVRARADECTVIGRRHFGRDGRRTPPDAKNDR